MEIKSGDVVLHSSRPGERLTVRSVHAAKAACKGPNDDEFNCKEYPVDELKLLPRQPRGPMRVTFG